MGDLLLDYGVLLASEFWLRQQQNKPSPAATATITAAAVEKPQGWNYNELHTLVQDLPMPAMIVDLDIFDSNIRSVCVCVCVCVCFVSFALLLAGTCRVAGDTVKLPGPMARPFVWPQSQ